MVVSLEPVDPARPCRTPACWVNRQSPSQSGQGADRSQLSTWVPQGQFRPPQVDPTGTVAITSTRASSFSLSGQGADRSQLSTWVPQGQFRPPQVDPTGTVAITSPMLSSLLFCWTINPYGVETFFAMQAWGSFDSPHVSVPSSPDPQCYRRCCSVGRSIPTGWRPFSLCKRGVLLIRQRTILSLGGPRGRRSWRAASERNGAWARNGMHRQSTSAPQDGNAPSCRWADLAVAGAGGPPANATGLGHATECTGRSGTPSMAEGVPQEAGPRSQVGRPVAWRRVLIEVSAGVSVAGGRVHLRWPRESRKKLALGRRSADPLHGEGCSSNQTAP